MVTLLLAASAPCGLAAHRCALPRWGGWLFDATVPVAMAYAALMTPPQLVVLLIVQRHLVEELARPGVKG